MSLQYESDFKLRSICHIYSNDGHAGILVVIIIIQIRIFQY